MLKENAFTEIHFMHLFYKFSLRRRLIRSIDGRRSNAVFNIFKL